MIPNLIEEAKKQEQELNYDKLYARPLYSFIEYINDQPRFRKVR